LVEVVPGEKTSPEAVDDAVAFLRSGRQGARVVRKEMPVLSRTGCNGRFPGCCYLVIQGVVKSAMSSTTS